MGALFVDNRESCGSIEADSNESGAFKHDWIKFFPSGFVTSGWSLGVVNV